MSRIAIVGGGISGLTCAYYLSKFGGSTIKQISLIESSNHLGGWIHSKKNKDGAVHELGPHSIRAYGKASSVSLELVEDLGLNDDVIPVLSSNPATKKRYIYARNQLHVLPAGLMSLIGRSSLLGESMLLKIVEDFYTEPGIEDDETIYDFSQRRFGFKVAELLVDPFVRGVFAGDCRQLSIRSCLPDIFLYERQFGSVIKGAFKTKPEPLPDSDLVRRSRAERWSVWSLRQGLGQLPDRLVSSLSDQENVRIQTNNPCTGVRFNQDGSVTVTTDNGDTTADCLIGATNSKRVVHSRSETNHGHHDNKEHLPLMARLTTLKRHLLRHYDVDIPPITELGHPVNVTIGYTLITLHSVSWHDPRLRWDADRVGVKDIRLGTDQIWTPDLALFNRVDDGHLLLIDEENEVPCMVTRDGNVTLVTPVIFQVMCKHTDREQYRCAMKIGSWAYSSQMVDVHLPDDGDDVDVDSFIPTVRNCQVLETRAEREVRRYGNDAFPLIHFVISVNRVD